MIVHTGTNLIHPAWMTKALDLLEPTQITSAFIHLTALKDVVERNPLGELAVMGPWFDKLSDDQQRQVIALYNAQLYDDYGLVLTEYRKVNGQQSDFRFEIVYPAPTR